MTNWPTCTLGGKTNANTKTLRTIPPEWRRECRKGFSFSKRRSIRLALPCYATETRTSFGQPAASFNGNALSNRLSGLSRLRARDRPECRFNSESTRKGRKNEITHLDGC